MDVLIVDDEYPLRAGLRRALALEGASGEEARECLEEQDVELPEPGEASR